mmetsp:Transcript_31158/g.81458  ORF Transcript_31158/g.81458 Transcript_31158/m.81458 type:complete len:381 (+) Transcript_31158:1297-2439(+)
MKVMNKHTINKLAMQEGPAPEGGWKELVRREREVLASVHHPLVVNLAYGFQNASYLVLVMDLVSAGDLFPFALDEPCLSHYRLTAAQLRFVAGEVLSVLAHLHSKFIIYRDLKPENLMLDATGHVRLVDFGLALMGVENTMPFSEQLAGTDGYMAPEVLHAGRCLRAGQGNVRYSAPADWYTFGVLVYELAEKALPFGKDPLFENHASEWRRPKGSVMAEDHTLFDLVSGLLEWDVEKRLGGGEAANTPAAAEAIRGHPYWTGGKLAPEWIMIENARLPSPLLSYVQKKLADAEADLAGSEQLEDECQYASDVMKHIVAEGAKAAATRAKIVEARGLNEAKRRAELEAFDRQQDNNYFENWDFVARQAIEAEYLSGKAFL